MTPEELQDLRCLPEFPRSAEDLIRAGGLEAAAALITTWPGVVFPCPIVFGKRQNGRGQRRYEQLIEVVGEHAARRYVQHYRGTDMLIPNCKDALWVRKQETIREHYDRLTSVGMGYSHTEAVFELCITYNYSTRCIEAVIKRPNAPPGDPCGIHDDGQGCLF